MTDTLRNMPRYIRNTDAFGWQGADGPDGPWRSITPPQTGTPWQTTDPMDDLRQASAEVSGVDVLSLPAQAVMHAATNGNANVVNDPVYKQCVAAALRAAARQLREAYENEECVPSPDDWLEDLANELENPQ